MLNLLIDNQGFIYAILTVLAIIFYAVKINPILKSKNIINKNNINVAIQLTTILAKVLLSKSIKLEDNIKNQAALVLDICSELLVFIVSVYDAKDDDELNIAIKTAIHNAFIQLGIQVNKDVQDVIDLGIVSAIHKSKVQ